MNLYPWRPTIPIQVCISDVCWGVTYPVGFLLLCTIHSLAHQAEVLEPHIEGPKSRINRAHCDAGSVYCIIGVNSQLASIDYLPVSPLLLLLFFLFFFFFSLFSLSFSLLPLWSKSLSLIWSKSQIRHPIYASGAI